MTSPAVFTLWLAASLVPASPRDWNAQRAPAPGPARAIGGTSGGCLAGAATLPASGPGYEVLHLKRNRRYGHPDLVAFVQRLGAAARAKKLGVVVVGDLSQPRGGPTPSGHRSHQTGLDVDVGYAAPAGLRAGHLSAADRERLHALPVIDLGTHQATPAWTPQVVTLLSTAASDPAVDRIFVNPAIKRMLCQGPSGKAPWMSRLRPWWGHHDHFHVRLKCPEGSPACVAQDQPSDDGCGASLDWWFSPDAQATLGRRKKSESSGPTVPEACAALLERSDDVAAR
ncbi:MAG TPA: penicillin-insensitive murein endopeptidase [Polyangia bacterium]|nr:penicillin-insensitive murein endopeptidase [Polyangia bacterium]